MGVFDWKDTEDKAYIKRIEKMISTINDEYAYKITPAVDRAFLDYAKGLCKNPGAAKIQPIELCTEIMETIVANKKDFAPTAHLATLRIAEEIYTIVLPYAENTPEFEIVATIFVNMFKEGGIASRGVFNPVLYSTFKHKKNYMELMDSLKKKARLKSCLYDITQYGVRVRAYFIDDDTYTANMKYVALLFCDSEDRQTIMEQESKRVERMAGIYEVDAADVAKTEEQLLKANTMLSQTMDILVQAEAKTEQLNRIMKDTTDTITEVSKRETNLITMKATTAREDINTAYNSFLEEQRQEVIIQKDVYVNQILGEAEGKLSELRAMARAITNSANAELLRINTEAMLAKEKIADLMADDEELERLISKADENRELYDRLSKLELLNTNSIEILEKNIEEHKAATVAQEKVDKENSTPRNAVEKENASVANINAATAASSVAVGSVAPQYTPVNLPPMEVDPQTIPEVNPLLDTSIPFETRYKLVMEEKARRMEKGEHFHKMFDDVITVLMEDANPYMIGPSGCGKTYMVKQIASILNLDFIDIGYINEEYDILGFQTATGAYSTPNFYRCYKYGKIAFCDELDNGNSRATVKLNSFLSNGKNAKYSFPHGENVKRHENFRIIAAGNTAGNGADANYNTREKIEESVQQRFTPVYVGYDNYVEEKILGDYKDWYQFCVLFRQATDSWGNKNDCAAPGIITTRDTARIKKYLDNKSLDMGRILDYEFIQTKDMEYLAFLAKFIGERVESMPEAMDIYALFNKKINELREKGGVR